MGYPKKDNAKSADGFLNLSITLPNGDVVRLRKGVPLDSSNRVERSLLNAAAADSDFTIALTGAIHAVVDESDVEDLIFG